MDFWDVIEYYERFKEYIEQNPKWFLYIEVKKDEITVVYKTNGDEVYLKVIYIDGTRVSLFTNSKKTGKFSDEQWKKVCKGTHPFNV
jgi:hypothetical protein